MKTIYLDNVSTTQMDSEVYDEMLPYLRANFGNPSSFHSRGQESRQAVENARKHVAGLIGCDSEEVIFTSGATESNNLAIKGVVKGALRSGKKHIISSPVEHYSVLHCIKSFKKDGIEVTTLDVDKFGRVDPEQVKREIREDTALVTVTHASNEIGTLEPIGDIGRITRERGVVFHTDATQTIGHMPINVSELNVDLMTISPHQFYGPKGVGGLYVRSGTRVMPIIEGGTQESGFRAGTENVAGIVGMGKAALLAQNSVAVRMEHLTKLRKHMQKGIGKIAHTFFTGHSDARIPGMLSLCFEYIEGESVLLFLGMQGIAASTGSACASALKMSHVLSAIGVDASISQGSIIFSLGKDNTIEDVDILLEKLPGIVEKLRNMSPLYNKTA